VRAAFGARSFGAPSSALIGIEAEPTHFEWMKRHFEDNGLDPKLHTLIKAAVAKRDGAAWFTAGTPGEWYGQRIALHSDIARRILRRSRQILPRTRPVPEAKSAGPPPYRLDRVETISLNTLLRPLDRVDLVDIDVQGAELDVLKAAAEQLNRKVMSPHCNA
jgi:FkbM family methyltransferase